jgi:hypothetical protein
MVRTYVQKNQIRYVQPPGRKHGFYLKKDVDRLATELNAFFNLEDEAESTTFVNAGLSDIPACIALNKGLFPDIQSENDDLLTQKWASWLQKNPETVYVLKKEAEVIGIFTLLPFEPGSEKLAAVLSADVSILLGNVNISADDLQEYKPGCCVELYVAEIGIKQDLDKFLRRK